MIPNNSSAIRSQVRRFSLPCDRVVFIGIVSACIRYRLSIEDDNIYACLLHTFQVALVQIADRTYFTVNFLINETVPKSSPHPSVLQRFFSLLKHSWYLGFLDSVAATACISIDRESTGQSAYISSCYSWSFCPPASSESKVSWLVVYDASGMSVSIVFFILCKQSF